MRNVRVIFKKTGRMKFVSHLDMNRFMTRMLRLSKIPLWYTEGFNPHVYLTFALPLSLGFESDYEIMDFRISDDNFTDEQALEALKAVVPDSIEIISVAPIKMKTAEIKYASFEIVFFGAKTEFGERLAEFLKSEKIEVEKSGKRGKVTVVDLKEKINYYSIDVKGEDVVLKTILPAGNTENINPTLLIGAMGDNVPFYNVRRTGVYDSQMQDFI